MTTGRPSRGKTPGRKSVAAAAPEFRELSTAAAFRVLRRNNVGRIAYALHDRVDVQPIHYVSDGRWLYVRTSPGLKTSVLSRNRWLALQTDEVESAFSWRSVVARGTAYVLTEDAPPDLATRHTRALRRIRMLIPEAFTHDDPVAFRSVILGIHVSDVTGREARTRGAARRSRSGSGRGGSGRRLR